MSKKSRPRKNHDGLAVGAGCLGIALVVLVNLAWVSLVVWGIVELILFLKRN